MPDISKLTMPSGTSYDIKDATAREAIANLQNTENILATDAASTPYGVTWDDDGTTITGTLVASSETVKKIYLVPASHPSSPDQNIFDEYLTLKVGSSYSWEKFGSTQIDLSGLGSLAYKDSATGSYTPTGSVSQPSFTGNAVTPSGTVSAPVISIASAGATESIAPVASVGALPNLTMTVSNENLTFAWDSGALPSLGTPISVKTSDATYEAAAPTFSGTEFTPSGTVSQPSFTGSSATITVS